MVQGTRHIKADQDFEECLKVTMAIVNQKKSMALETGDESLARYLTGMLRGIEMCEETYRICLEHQRRQSHQGDSFACMVPNS